MTERWLPVVGYEGYYEVSDRGRVRSVDRVVEYRDGRVRRYAGVALKQAANPQGHMQVRLSRRSSTRLTLVHRLVAEAFVPNPDGHPLVRHWDDDPANNRSTNLRWGDQVMNMQDAARNGRNHNSNRKTCDWGHVLEGANIRVRGKKRVCIPCARRRSAAWHERKKMESIV